MHNDLFGVEVTKLDIVVLLFSFVAGITPLTLVGLEQIQYINPHEYNLLVTRYPQIIGSETILTWFEPPLRQFPLLGVLALGIWAGFTPFTTIAAYTLFIEFVVIPTTLWWAVKRSTGGRAALASLIIYAFFIHLLMFRFQSMFVAGYWYYAYAIPYLLIVLGLLSSPGPRYKAAGYALGALFLAQQFFAGLGALTVAIVCLYRQEIREIFTVAIRSIVVSVIAVPWLITHSEVLGQKSPTIESLQIILAGMSVRETIFVITVGAFAVLLAVGYYTDNRVVTWLQQSVDDIWAIFFTVTLTGYTFGATILDLYWYHLIFAYLVRFAGFSIAGIIAGAFVSEFSFTFLSD